MDIFGFQIINVIRGDKSAEGGVVIARLQVIEVEVAVKVISAVAEGIDKPDMVAVRGELIAVRVIDLVIPPRVALGPIAAGAYGIIDR